MPTYGYRCASCATEWDIWQRMSDAAGAACPTCGGAGRRLIFPAGIVFKGSGFYKTDSRNGSASTPAPTPARTGSEVTPPTGAAPSKAPAAPTPAAGGGTTASARGPGDG